MKENTFGKDKKIRSIKENEKWKRKKQKVIAAGLLVMSLTMACNSALAPILAEVGKFFPDASDSAIQIVLTLINLVTLPMMLLEPLMEPKITKKRYCSYWYCF